MLKLPIYLDNQSTTPVDPRVMKEMSPYFTEVFGNAASRSHEFGWKAEYAVEKARDQVAKLIGSEPEEIVFTSGATESINLAIKGAASAYLKKGKHIITAATEHKAVMDVCRVLEKHGFEVTYLGVDRYGLLDMNELMERMRADTIIVSIMHANNEIGTLQPVDEIGKLCRDRGVLFHTDAVQSAGKLPIDVRAMNIDLMSISAHKIYGPKGTGALFVNGKKPRVKLLPQVDGGGHEKGLRSGTLNVPGIAGFGKACEIALNEMGEESKKLGGLRDRLFKGLSGKLDEVYLNGHPQKRLYNNLNLSFAYADADSLMASIKEIAVSSGSACTSASAEPSHVLKAIGLSDELQRCSVRFSPGRFNTQEEVDYTVTKFTEKVRWLRDISPAYKFRRKKNDLKDKKSKSVNKIKTGSN